jgi:hypothetical protein
MLKKMLAYENMVKEVEFEEKLEELKKGGDQKKIDRYVKKGPSKGAINPYYLAIDPLKDYLIKKEICPTITLDLYDIIKKYAKTTKIIDGKQPMVIDQNGRNVYFGGPTILEKMDNSIIDNYVNFCVPAYVLDIKEFTYAKNTKKALKLILDSSGYISEKVIWPDYETGELKYPESLKKGCLAMFFYLKKPQKDGCNIYQVSVEVESDNA